MWLQWQKTGGEIFGVICGGATLLSRLESRDVPVDASTFWKLGLGTDRMLEHLWTCAPLCGVPPHHMGTYEFYSKENVN